MNVAKTAYYALCISGLLSLSACDLIIASNALYSTRLELPQSEPVVETNTGAFAVQINADNTLSLNGRQVSQTALISYFADLPAHQTELDVVLRAAPETNGEDVLKLIGDIRGAGMASVLINTDPKTGTLE